VIICKNAVSIVVLFTSVQCRSWWCYGLPSSEFGQIYAVWINRFNQVRVCVFVTCTGKNRYNVGQWIFLGL